MPFSGKVTSLQSVSDLCCLRFIRGKIAYTQLSQEKWQKVTEETVQHFLGLREPICEGSVNTVVPSCTEMADFLYRYSCEVNWLYVFWIWCWLVFFNPGRFFYLGSCGGRKKKTELMCSAFCGNILLRVKLKVNSFSTLRINSLAIPC